VSPPSVPPTQWPVPQPGELVLQPAVLAAACAAVSALVLQPAVLAVPRAGLSAPAYFAGVFVRLFCYLCVRYCAVAVPLAALPFVLLLLLLAVCT
jgi:hypothetical protein